MASSKSSSVIGFALIGVILLVFSWYNTKQYEKQQIAQLAQDSIARANSPIPESINDTADYADVAVELEAESIQDTVSGPYLNNYLNSAYNSEPEYFNLENDKVKITVSSLGAQPYQVLVKDYYTYDSSDLYLIKPNKSLFDFQINADQWINTSSLNFEYVSGSDANLVLRLLFDEDSYIETQYILPEDSYLVDYDFKMVNMDEYLDRRTNNVTFQWVWDVPRLEKGYQNEKNYSTVDYQFVNSTDVKTLGLRKDSASESIPSKIKWFAFQQQYFSIIFDAENCFESGSLVNKFYPENEATEFLMNSGAEMALAIDPMSKDQTMSFKMFFGPNHYPTLKSLDRNYEKIIPLGKNIIGVISRFIIIPMFNWLNNSFANYGLIILIMTLIIKIVISPLTMKSYLSSAKMKVLKPEIDKINAKYPKQEDAMKKQQATMDLYKRAGVNMWGGCLPALLQFPILFAMFRFFPASFELRQQPFLWCDDLSAYDSILDFGFNIPLYGNHVSLFALLMGVSMWFYSKMTIANTDTSAMPGMKFMQVWFMPIFMVLICNNFSAGLSYYYMLSNLVTMAQYFIIKKWMIDEDKIYAQLQAKANSKEAPKKSKFQQRLEEAYKIQQEQAKNNKR